MLSKCFQVTGILINIFINLLAIGSIIIGTLLFVKPDLFHNPLLNWNDLRFVADTIKLYLLIVGCSAMLLSFFGILALAIKSFYLRVIHFGVTLSIFFMVLILMIVGCLFVHDLNNIISQIFIKAWDLYENNPEIQKAIDNFQSRNLCCGTTVAGEAFPGPVYPSSCCPTGVIICDKNAIFQNPCIHPMQQLLSISEKIILAFLIAACSFTLIQAVYMVYLAKRSIPRFFIGNYN